MSGKTTTQLVDLSKAGIYNYGLGRRKTSSARARVYFDAPKELRGKAYVNGEEAKSYFMAAYVANLTKPLEVVGVKKGDVCISLKVIGGGKAGQSEAARLAVSRALLDRNTDLKSVLRAAGYLTRDPRMKERKKPGLKGARRATQWTKR